MARILSCPSAASLAAATCMTLLLLALSFTSVSFAQAKSLPNGAVCFFRKNRTPTTVACKSPYLCVVNKVLPTNSRYSLQGNCIGSLTMADYDKYCSFRSTLYAVGTVGIRDSSNCDRCDCKKVGGKAQCVCQPGSACRVDKKGVAVKGHECKSSVQTQCLITSSGKDFDTGSCVAPQTIQASACISAGPDYGPIFYTSGTVGATGVGDKCQRCTCVNGELKSCQKLQGCTK